MGVTYTTKLALGQMAKGDLVGAWHTLWNSDNLNLETRLTKSYAGNPNGQVEGNWKGQQCWDETNLVMYYCQTTGDAATAVWVTPTVNFYALAPSGTLMLWGGTDATIPSGWAKVTAADGRVLRFTNTEATIGTVLGADSITPVMQSAGAHDHGGNTGSHVLTEAEIPAHTHSYSKFMRTGSGNQGNLSVGSDLQKDIATNTTSTGGGTGHTHTIANQAAHTHVMEAFDNRPAAIHYTLIRKN